MVLFTDLRDQYQSSQDGRLTLTIFQEGLQLQGLDEQDMFYLSRIRFSYLWKVISRQEDIAFNFLRGDHSVGNIWDESSPDMGMAVVVLNPDPYLH